jgi:hypothetical protein
MLRIWVTTPVNGHLDPKDASRTIVRHFQGDALLTLIRGQVNHAGVEIIEPAREVDGAVSMPELSSEQQQAFNRVIQYSDKLFEALEDLEAHGGLKALARVIRPGSIEKATTALKGVRQAIDDQLTGLKTDRPKPKPKPQSPTPPPPPSAPADPQPPAGAPDAVPIRRTRRDRG